MKTRGGDEPTIAVRKPSDSASASGSGERLERRGAKIGGKLQRGRQQNKPTGESGRRLLSGRQREEMGEKSENVLCLNVLMEVRRGGGGSRDPDSPSILPHAAAAVSSRASLRLSSEPEPR